MQSALQCQNLTDINCLITIIDPQQTSLILSAQPDFMRSPGIVRGSTHPITNQVTDFTTNARGEPLTGNQAREGIWSFSDHLKAFESEALHAELNLVGFVGAGNLLMNRGVVGWLNDNSTRPQGAYYVSGEGTWWDQREPWVERTYDSLVVDQDNAVDITELNFRRQRFADDNHSDLPELTIAYASKAWSNKSSNTIKYAVSGQRIVKNSATVDFSGLVGMAQNGHFYDLNHLFQFPWVNTSVNPEWGYQWADPIIFGYRQFYQDTAGERQLNPEIIADAMTGALVQLSIGKEVWQRQCNDGNQDLFLKKLRGNSLPQNPAIHLTGFKWRGYAEQNKSPMDIGSYCIDKGQNCVYVKFLPGVYRHNIIALTKNGLLLSIQVTGLSLRCGMTVMGLAKLVANMQVIGGAAGRIESKQTGAHGDHVTDAIILDNGGDVVLNYAHKGSITHANFAEDWVLKSENHRANLRTLILFAEAKNNSRNERAKTLRYPLSALLAGSWRTHQEMIWFG